MKPLLHFDSRGLADLGEPFRELGEKLRETGWISAPFREIGATLALDAPIRETIAQFEEANAPLRKVATTLRETIAQFEEESAPLRKVLRETTASMAVVSTLDAPPPPAKRGRGRPKGTGPVQSDKALLAEWQRLVAANVEPYKAARMLTRLPGSPSPRHLVRVGKGLT